jgi:hypothetical protein
VSLAPTACKGSWKSEFLAFFFDFITEKEQRVRGLGEMPIG